MMGAIRAVGALLLILTLQSLALFSQVALVDAQQNGCRTPAAGSHAVTNYCASEAFVSQHFPAGPVTAGHIAVFADTSGQILDDGGAPPTSLTVGSTSIAGGTDHCVLFDDAGVVGCSLGVLLNKNKSISGNYPIVATDAGLTLNWSGSPGTITLPGVGTFNSIAAVRVCNNNANDATHHAATLSGFPGFPVSPTPHLWMGQCIGVAIQNGAWQVIEQPGKFVPGFALTCYVDTGGSNSNSGLVSNASTSAVYDPQQCINIWQNEIELGGQQPIVALTCNQIFNQDGGAGAFFYAIRPTRVIFLVANGSCGGRANWPKLRNPAGTVITELSDFGGYVIFDQVKFDCTNAHDHPCYGTFNHQQNGIDYSNETYNNGVEFVGAASTDVGVWCDSVCKINTGAALVFSGAFNNLIQLDKTSVFDLNVGMVLENGLSVSKNIVQADSGTQFQWSGALTSLGSAAVGQIFTITNGATMRLATFSTSGTITGARQWAVLNNGLLCNRSATAVPGTAGVNTGVAGWADGIIAASTGGVCFP